MRIIRSHCRVMRKRALQQFVVGGLFVGFTAYALSVCLKNNNDRAAELRKARAKYQ